MRRSSEVGLGSTLSYPQGEFEAGSAVGPPANPCYCAEHDFRWCFLSAEGHWQIIMYYKWKGPETYFRAQGDYSPWSVFNVYLSPSGNLFYG